MSDEPDYVGDAIRTDDRFATIDLDATIKAELRDSHAVKAMMAAVRMDAWDAMRNLADISPADERAVAKELVAIRTLVYIDTVLQRISNRARVAEQSIHVQTQAQRENGDYE